MPLSTPLSSTCLGRCGGWSCPCNFPLPSSPCFIVTFSLSLWAGSAPTCQLLPRLSNAGSRLPVQHCACGSFLGAVYCEASIPGVADSTEYPVPASMSLTSASGLNWISKGPQEISRADPARRTNLAIAGAAAQLPRLPPHLTLTLTLDGCRRSFDADPLRE